MIRFRDLAIGDPFRFPGHDGFVCVKVSTRRYRLATGDPRFLGAVVVVGTVRVEVIPAEWDGPRCAVCGELDGERHNTGPTTLPVHTFVQA